MSKFHVFVKSSAQRELAKIPRTDQIRIAESIKSLESNPRPLGCKKMVNADYWRIRVGQYRIVYSIEDKMLIIEIIRIGHRKDIYR